MAPVCWFPLNRSRRIALLLVIRAQLVADVDILLYLLPNLSLFYSSIRISKRRRRDGWPTPPLQVPCPLERLSSSHIGQWACARMKSEKAVEARESVAQAGDLTPALGLRCE